MRILKTLLSLIKNCKYWFIATSLIAFIEPSLSAYGHVYYAKILSSLGKNGIAFSPEILHNLILLTLIYVSIDISDGLQTYFDARVKIRYQRTMHNNLFKHTHKHSTNFFNTEQSGVILAKMGNLIFGTFHLFYALRSRILPNLAFFITSAILFFNISPSLFFSLMTICILEIFLIYALYKKVKQYAKTSAKEESKAAGIMVDSIANARLVKNSAAIYHEKRTLRHQINAFIRAKIAESKISGISNMQHTLLYVIFTIINFSAVLFFYYYQNLSLENIILTATLLIRLGDRSADIATLFDRLQTQFGIMNDAIELLYRPFEVTDVPHAKTLKIKQNSVEFKNATFSYKKNKPLFNKLNLTIAPNEKLGLVGISGSGKSTLINLILRAFDLKSGKILISGQDISKVTQYSLHQHIALISQEPCLFNRSIMENIRFAKPKATDEEVYQAAKLAHIHDVILKMPKGYDSVVGERGVKLSGGERQRIAIAAAILKDTPILILDEATSALDSQSEQAIEKALKELMKNKTVIAIAHRLSTLKNMDKIAVLDKGEIIEYGNEKELLKNKSGTFYKLYKLQSGGYLQE